MEGAKQICRSPSLALQADPKKQANAGKRAQTRANADKREQPENQRVTPPFIRGRHGGVEKRGGWKTSRMTPLPKRGFGPPRTLRFPPPSGVSALFFLYKNPRQSSPEALLEGSNNFRESAFSGAFSSPHTFAPPPWKLKPGFINRVLVEVNF